jgi:hypothetical protein
MLNVIFSNLQLFFSQKREIQIQELYKNVIFDVKDVNYLVPK